MTVTEGIHDGVVADLQDKTSTSAPTQKVAQGVAGEEGDVLEGRVVLVDQPNQSGHVDLLAELATRRQERAPLIPIWLRSRADALQVLKWQAEHTAYVLAYTRSEPRSTRPDFWHGPRPVPGDCWWNWSTGRSLWRAARCGERRCRGSRPPSTWHCRGSATTG